MSPHSDASRRPDAPSARQWWMQCVSAALLAVVIAVLALASPTPALAGNGTMPPATIL
ncbi:MAG TPA: hypothetical protein VEA17_24655 [Bordetella sp.]|nr:hypothetical protein [Bordetella sp.]